MSDNNTFRTPPHTPNRVRNTPPNAPRRQNTNIGNTRSTPAVRSMQSLNVTNINNLPQIPNTPVGEPNTQFNKTSPSNDPSINQPVPEQSTMNSVKKYIGFSGGKRHKSMSARSNRRHKTRITRRRRHRSIKNKKHNRS